MQKVSYGRKLSTNWPKIYILTFAIPTEYKEWIPKFSNKILPTLLPAKNSKRKQIKIFILKLVYCASSLLNQVLNKFFNSFRHLLSFTQIICCALDHLLEARFHLLTKFNGEDERRHGAPYDKVFYKDLSAAT